MMHPEFDDERPFRDFINGLQRRLGKQTKHTEMASVEDITAILEFCDSEEATPAQFRLGVVITIMLSTCSRKADCIRLTATCIWGGDTHLVIYFVTSKTDIYRLGHYKYISKKHDRFGSCARIIRYLKLVGLWRLDSTSPFCEAPIFVRTRYSNQLKKSVFCQPSAEDGYISTNAIDASFRELRPDLKLSPGFVLHGIRVFVGSAQFQANIPLEQIYRSGHWVSKAMEQYIEPDLATLLSSSEAVSDTAPGPRLSTVPPPDWWPTDDAGPSGWSWNGGVLDLDIADIEA